MQAYKASPLHSPIKILDGEGAGGDPRKSTVKSLVFDPKKPISNPSKDTPPVIKPPPERSQSVNGEDVSQNPSKTGQYNQIDVESTPAVQGINEKVTEQINTTPNLSRSGIGQNLFPTVQDETQQQIGAPVNPTDKMAGVSEQFNESPLLKLLADNLFMTEATKQPVETGIDAIKDIGASNIVKTLMGPMGTAGELLNEGNIKGYDSQVTTGLQKGVISLAELGSVPFLALDNLVKQIPDVGEDISGISQVPFIIMGETGKDVNKSIRDFLGFKLEDPEQEVLADEIAGVLAQFIIPAGIGKGLSLGTKGFKKLTEIKGIVESIPEPLRTTENIRKLLPEGIKERRIVDEKGNVTTEKVPTGDLTVDRLAESKENIKKNPTFTEDAPRITNTDAGIFDKGELDNSFNIVDKGVKPDRKSEALKQNTIPKLLDLVERSKTEKDFLGFIGREFPYKKDLEIAKQLHDFGYVKEKSVPDNMMKPFQEYYRLNKKVEEVSPVKKFLDDFNPTELEKERAQEFIKIKRDGNLNLNSVEGTHSLKPHEVRKGLIDVKKGNFKTDEAKFVTDKINKAYETGIENNATRQDPRKTKMSADELKGLTKQPPTFDKYLSDIMEGQGIKEIPNQSFVDSWKKQYEKKWGKEEVKPVINKTEQVRQTFVTKEKFDKLTPDKQKKVYGLIQEYRQSGYIDASLVLPDQNARTTGRQRKSQQETTLKVFEIENQIKELLKSDEQLKTESVNKRFDELTSRENQLNRQINDIETIFGDRLKSVKPNGHKRAYEHAKGELEKLTKEKDNLKNVDIIKDAFSKQNLDFMGLSKLSDITKPEVLKAVKEVAQYHITNNAKSFGDFARKMVKDVGQWIKPHLRKLWEETKKVFTGETALVDQNSMSVGIPKLNDKMSEPFSTAKEVKNDTPKGTEKSDFKPNEKTIHGDIKREIRDYLKSDLELMRELRRQKITDVTALEGGVKFGVKIAEELGGINYVKNLKEGSVFPIEQHLGIVGFATKTLKDALKNKDLPTVDRLEAFYSYYKAEAISGELGRSLRGRQLIPRLPIEDIKGIAKDLIDSPDVPVEMKKQVKEMTEEIAKNPNVIKEPNWYDKAKYVLYNAMLSRPLTHARNMVGNTTHLFFEILQNPNIGTLKGLNRGRKNIIPALKKVWNEGGDVSKFTEGIYEPKNKIVRNFMPTSWLKFEDIVFKELSKGMATEWQGKQLAKEKGIDVKTAISSIESVMQGKSLKGKEAMERISKAVDEIEEYAKFVTFQKDLGFRGQKFQSWIKSMPGSELIIPFIRTPANILKVGLQPLKVLKFVSPEYRAKFREMSPLMKRQELVRITAGTVAYVTLYELMAQGVIDITGQGADDKSKRDFMEAQGWKPNSIKIGSKYFSYQNINPFNVGLGLIGNYNDGLKYNYKPKDDKLNPIQKLSKTLAGFVQTTTDQSFLRGLSELSKWQEDENPYYLEGFVNALIPNILSVTKDVQTDETAYENKTLGDKVNSKIGGKNRPRINVFGEVEENSGTGLPFTLIPPRLGNSEKTDELSKILLDSNTTISYPKKFVKSDGQETTDEELYNFTKESGQKIKQKLMENINLIKGMTSGEIDSEVDRVVNKIRGEVKEQMFGEKNKSEKHKYKIKL